MALTQDQDAARVRLTTCAGFLYGDRWQSALAWDLSQVGKRTVSQSQVGQWKLGIRPIPQWVEEAMPEVVRFQAQRLRQHAEFAEQLYPRSKEAKR